MIVFVLAIFVCKQPAPSQCLWVQVPPSYVNEAKCREVGTSYQTDPDVFGYRCAIGIREAQRD